MKVLCVLALCFLGLASAATKPPASPAPTKKHHNIVLDYVHNYRFEEHKNKLMNHTLLIAVSDVRGEKVCHVIAISRELKKALNNHNYMQDVTEEIFNLIDSGDAKETKVNHGQIFKKYYDHKLVNECKKHKLFAMEFEPSVTMAPKTVNKHHKHHGKNNNLVKRGLGHWLHKTFNKIFHRHHHHDDQTTPQTPRQDNNP